MKTSHIPVLLLVVCCLAAYGNALGGDFIWDDTVIIVDNELIRSWSNIGAIFTSDMAAGVGIEYHYYRPVLLISYLLDYTVWKLNPLGYHLTNVLLHLLVVVGLYRLSVRLTRDRFLSFASVILFAVHPVFTEAVTYISGRNDVLVSLFLIISVNLYADISRRFRKVQAGMLGITCVLALLSKENAVVLPVLLLAFNGIYKTKVKRKIVAAVLSLTIAYLAVRSSILGGGSTDWISSVPDRIPGMFAAIFGYLRLLVSPVDLHIVYGQPEFFWTDLPVLGGMVVTAALLAAAYRCRNTVPLISFGGLWFLITLLPAANIYPVFSYMSERYLYVPAIGLFWMAGSGLARLYRVKKYRTGSIALVGITVIVLIGLTVQQNTFWRDSVIFSQRQLQFDDGNWLSYLSLSRVYWERGQTEAAIRALHRVIELRPDYSQAYGNLGLIHDSIGRKEKAVSYYREAIELNSNDAPVFFNLGTLLFELERKGEAIDYFRRAVTLRPQWARAHYNLALALYLEGNLDEAGLHFDLARKRGYPVPETLEFGAQ